MATCPRCKSQDSTEEKSWDVIPKTGKGAAMRVTAYRCNSCGGKFRKAVKLDRPQIAPDTPTPTVAPVAIQSEEVQESMLHRLRERFHL